MSLHYKRAGSGQPVILLHGLFGALDNLGHLARQLAEEYDVISIDLPNHGLSPHTNDIGYPQMAAQVAEIINQL